MNKRPQCIIYNGEQFSLSSLQEYLCIKPTYPKRKTITDTFDSQLLNYITAILAAPFVSNINEANNLIAFISKQTGGKLKNKSKYTRTNRKYTDSKGKQYTIYNKDSKEYIKKLSKVTRKFSYRQIN